ncbi:DUF6969 family protein [Telmatospirillum siberiense]|uniref:DUF6969 domain-containing protein n=1 Tax=Telmatospirillum siberiense TaxID=382514 RepID=A0A2N3PNE9_9PROT|nr:hypothetical protein [Telmatospirillum siberiense]PKU21922.1 hypothetical protein CWS72_24355 [Telmatospirillum siberiense]
MRDDPSSIFDANCLADLPAPLLAEMTGAADVYLACRARLTAEGKTIAEDIAGDDLEPYTHYPRGDVYDPASHAQYYFHLHRLADHGHFHTFLRAGGMPRGLSPSFGSSRQGEGEPLCHLVAIGLDHRGELGSLFTTNRWVTAETWYPAADVIAMLPRFRIAHEGAARMANQWVQAVLTMFRPQIAGLLRTRDACVARHAVGRGDEAALEDRRLEITSSLAVDVDDHIRILRAAATPVSSGSPMA